MASNGEFRHSFGFRVSASKTWGANATLQCDISAFRKAYEGMSLILSYGP